MRWSCNTISSALSRSLASDTVVLLNAAVALVSAGSFLYAAALLAVPGAALTAEYAPVDGGIAEAVDKAAAIAQTAAREDAPPYAETLYRNFCASCHDGENTGAPSREALEMLSSSQIIDAMTRGVIAQQAVRLPGFDKEILATYLAAKTDDARLRGRTDVYRGARLGSLGRRSAQFQVSQ